MTTWLIDKSAIGRLHLADDASAWARRIERGLIRICTAELTGQPVERLHIA